MNFSQISDRVRCCHFAGWRSEGKRINDASWAFIMWWSRASKLGVWRGSFRDPRNGSGTLHCRASRIRWWGRV
jgi:hypothetical protein